MSSMEEETVVSSPSAMAPDTKKRKVDWRTKCKEEFDLMEVPEIWKDQVSEGSEEAWERYYNYRIDMKERIKKMDKEAAEDDYDMKGELEAWKERLENLQKEIWNNDANKKWQVDLFVSFINWEDFDEIRTVFLHPQVYSPFMIPRVMDLKHRYHNRERMSFAEFYCIWEYKFIDFENYDSPDEEQQQEKEKEEKKDGDEDAKKKKMKKKKNKYSMICSNCFENQALQFEVIETYYLNAEMVHSFRNFLLGTTKPESQTLFCRDYDLLRLLFCSMGTDGKKIMRQCPLGHTWKVYNGTTRDMLIREGVIPKEEEQDPSVSWLEHAIRKASGALRPIDGYYEPPRIEHAPGYQEEEQREEGDCVIS